MLNNKSFWCLKQEQMQKSVKHFDSYYENKNEACKIDNALKISFLGMGRKKCKFVLEGSTG